MEGYATYIKDGNTLVPIVGPPGNEFPDAPVDDGLYARQNGQWVSLQGHLTNPNILHNWDFRNPVNQRGQTSYTGTGYTIDRWRNNTSTIVTTVVDGGISVYNVDANNGLAQYIESPHQLVGKTCTMSIMIGGTVYSVTGSIPDIPPPTQVIPLRILPGNGAIVSLVISVNASMYVGLFANNATVNFQAVKLEIGSVSTLANDPPMDHSVELPKCQRYYQVLGSGTQGYFTAVDTITISQVIPVTMRVGPSVSLLKNSFTISAMGNGGNIVTQNSVASGFSTSANGIAWGGINGFTAASTLIGKQALIVTDNVLALSADL